MTSTLTDASSVWAHSQTLSYDEVAALSATTELYVSGSAQLVRALLADGLVDELHLYVYPVAVGQRLRLFPDDAPRTPLALLDVERLSNGVAHLVYGPVAAQR